MDIISNEKFLNLKDNVLKKLELDFNHYIENIEKNKMNVNNWKFATEEYFTPIPFSNELEGRKKGRLLKLETDKINVVYEALKKNNYYAFGFSENGKLLIMMNTIDKHHPQYTIYNHEDNGVYYFHANIYSDKSPKNKLISVGVLTGINDNLQFNVSVSCDKKDWSATIYEYKDNLLDMVYRTTARWQDTKCEYKFIYENNILKKITSYTILDVWKNEE